MFAPADVSDLDEHLNGDLQVSAVGDRPVVVGAEGAEDAEGGDEQGDLYGYSLEGRRRWGPTRLPGVGSRAAQFNSVKRFITAAPSVPAR